MQQISAPELARLLAEPDADAIQLLDVREDWEYEIAHLPDSTHLPMQRVPAELGRLDPDRPLVCICHHGVRSMQVAMFLSHRGFDRVMNLAGGIDAWSTDVDPSVPRY